MEIKSKDYCGYLVIELRGEIEESAVLSKIELYLSRAIEDNKHNVAIDLHSCDYINSGLIGLFMGWKEKLSVNNKKFCLIEPSVDAMEVLTVTGIPEVLTIYKNEVDFAQKSTP